MQSHTLVKLMTVKDSGDTLTMDMMHLKLASVINISLEYDEILDKMPL